MAKVNDQDVVTGIEFEEAIEVSYKFDSGVFCANLSVTQVLT
ncbi:hypothetical protein [Colwellia sp. E2M01]|nr:hypothetical protein [Colwellia sp. E2M01]